MIELGVKDWRPQWMILIMTTKLIQFYVTLDGRSSGFFRGIFVPETVSLGCKALLGRQLS